MATTVRITETYDMKTTVGKMGVVGIHTPQTTLLRKLYPGLMKNHKYIRFMKCDVVGACASVLPADPLQVGVEAGDVAPEDMFNPILYTAVTNSSFDSLVARIRSLTDVSTLNSVAEGDLVPAGWFSEENNFKTYYSLLAENGKFKKSMPQSGFMIKGLVPLAHTVISTFGNVGSIGNNSALAPDGENEVSVPDMDVPQLDESMAVSSTPDKEVFYRGKAIKMPRIPLHTTIEEPSDIPYPNIPKTNVLALVLPPARLHEFWYRMRVSWTIRFEGVCSTLEAGKLTTFIDVGGYAHGQNFSYTSKSSLEKSEDMVDVTDVEINKVMES